MREWFIEYFASFSRRERNGFLWFTIFVLLILAVRVSLPYFLPEKPLNPNDFIEFLKPTPPHKLLKPFVFDPNEVTKDDLDSMKIPQNISNSWLAYIDKGGFFNTPADLRKLYGLTDSIFITLEPFMIVENIEKHNFIAANSKQNSNQVREKFIDKKQLNFPINLNLASFDSLLLFGFSNFSAQNIIRYRNKGAEFFNISDVEKIYGIDTSWLKQKHKYLIFPIDIKETKTIKKIDINLATEEDLLAVPGIGPVFSKRILAYKQKLGGFYNPNQIKEVYGLKDFNINSLDNYFYFSDSLCQKIDLNKIEFNQLLKQPYFEYYLVKKIFDLKNQKNQISYIDLEQSSQFFPPE